VQIRRGYATRGFPLPAGPHSRSSLDDRPRRNTVCRSPTRAPAARRGARGRVRRRVARPPRLADLGGNLRSRTVLATWRGLSYLSATCSWERKSRAPDAGTLGELDGVQIRRWTFSTSAASSASRSESLRTTAGGWKGLRPPRREIVARRRPAHTRPGSADDTGWSILSPGSSGKLFERFGWKVSPGLETSRADFSHRDQEEPGGAVTVPLGRRGPCQQAEEATSEKPSSLRFVLSLHRFTISRPVRGNLRPRSNGVQKRRLPWEGDSDRRTFSV